MEEKVLQIPRQRNKRKTLTQNASVTAACAKNGHEFEATTDDREREKNAIRPHSDKKILYAENYRARLNHAKVIRELSKGGLFCDGERVT